MKIIIIVAHSASLIFLSFLVIPSLDQNLYRLDCNDRSLSLAMERRLNLFSLGLDKLQSPLIYLAIISLQ